MADAKEFTVLVKISGGEGFTQRDAFREVVGALDEARIADDFNVTVSTPDGSETEELF